MLSESGCSTRHEWLEGRYANFFQVGHNSIEFVLGFGQVYNDSNAEVLHTKIITSPSYAKVLLDVLQDSVQKYEREFGEIQRPY